MDYHVARNSQKLGVFPEADVRTRLQSGEFLLNDLVWCEGMSAWRPAAEVFPGATAPVPPPVGSSIPPPAAPLPPAPGPKPTNYLVPAILVTLFCCLPFGIASIVFAAQVDSKYAAGDYAGAQQSSDRAKFWVWLSVGIGLLWTVAVICLAFIPGLLAALSAGNLPH